MKIFNNMLRKFAACVMAVSVLMGGYLPLLEVYATEGTSTAVVAPNDYRVNDYWKCDIDHDARTVTLRYYKDYKSTGDKVIVYGKYWINGDEYTTKLEANCSNMFNLGAYGEMTGDRVDESVENNITSITFDPSIDTSNVTNMSGMFNGCGKLTELDISHFKTQNVTNMSSMFANCLNITNLDVDSFDTSNVKTMAQMFDGMGSLRELDLKNFNTSSVTNMDRMFQNCGSLTKLDLSSFDTRAVVERIQKTVNKVDLDGAIIDETVGAYAPLKWMFEGCDSMTDLILLKDDEHWTIPNEFARLSEMYTGEMDTDGDHTGIGGIKIPLPEPGPDGGPKTPEEAFEEYMNQLTGGGGSVGIIKFPAPGPAPKPGVSDLGGFYNAEAGKWQRTIDGIQPYGKCRDHRNGILGVKVKDGIFAYYWVMPDGSTMADTHK